jgi:hypothetical protein
MQNPPHALVRLVDPSRRVAWSRDRDRYFGALG